MTMKIIEQGLEIDGKTYDHISTLKEGSNLIRVRKHRGKIKLEDFITVKGGLWIERKKRD